MYTRPDSVKVGPYIYKIELDTEDNYDYNFWGRTSFQRATIDLASHMPSTHIPHTLLHEILHALGNTYEIKYWEQHEKDDKGNHIDKIDMMATALLQFLRDNPEAVYYLMGK